ncbi:MAG TPA: DUF3786 domain-containing protein [Thermodesulfobacteriota bacterium]|nr:DUF3786 domain-containing protein [Thermodesulfobacteriota bacterium]
MDSEQKASVFEQIYRDYLRQLRQVDLQRIANRIGVEMEGDSMMLPLFGQRYKISSGGIVGPSGKEPIHSIKVVLCQYLLHMPAEEVDGRDWVSYKDFKDASPFVGGFQSNTEKAIAKNFAARLEALRRACLQLGGKDTDLGWGYQLSMKFNPLPLIPILLLFNDADEEFPAQCLLLFERRAEKYLDMESMAILAWLLTDYLNQSQGNVRTTVM